MYEALPHCPGCGTALEEVHDPVCAVARCRATGLQFHSCDHRATAPVPHDREVWTGRWPGEDACLRLGWYARLEPGHGWVRCDAAAAGAEPDLNRLFSDATWDPMVGRWLAAQ